MAYKISPDARRLLSMMPPEQLLPFIVQALGQRADRERILGPLLVRLANQLPGASMYGITVTDLLPDAEPNAPLVQHISPYPRITAGALGVVIAEDKNHVLHILLGSKDVPKPISGGGKSGLEMLWLPGGFMAPGYSYNPQDTYTENLPARRAYELSRLEANAPVAASEPINRLTDIAPVHDHDLKETMQRTLETTTGLKLGENTIHLASEGMDNLTVSGKPYQQQINTYLINADNAREGLPPIQEGGAFKSLQWVPLRDIVKEGKHFNYKGAQIVPEYMESIEKAVALYHKTQIESSGFTSAAIDKAMAVHNPEIKKPETELGTEAATWHDNALTLSKQMSTQWTNSVLSPPPREQNR